MTLIVGVCAKKRIDIFTPSILFRNTLNFTPKSIFCWHPRYPIKRMIITKKMHILKSQQPILKLKLKHCEKATIWKKYPTYFAFYSVTSKQVRDFFQIFVHFIEIQKKSGLIFLELDFFDKCSWLKASVFCLCLEN